MRRHTTRRVVLACAICVVATHTFFLRAYLDLGMLPAGAVVDNHEEQQYSPPFGSPSVSAPANSLPDHGDHHSRGRERRAGGRRRRYLKYDEAGTVLRAHVPANLTPKSHGLPHAVPSSRTVPRHLAEDRRYHLSQRTNTSARSIRMPPRKRGEYDRWNHDYGRDFRTLYLYNPSVLPLHNTIANNDDGDAPPADDDDPDLLSTSDLSDLTGDDPTVRYLATFRAYLGNNCFGVDPDREMMRAGEQISYLAVALLDEELSVVPGSDVLVDMNAAPGYGKYWRQFREDCRIFLLRGNLYLLCNDRIHPVRIRRRRRNDDNRNASGGGGGANASASTNAKKEEDKTSSSTVIPGEGDPEFRIPYVYPNLYGDGLEITLLGADTKIAGGKNFNLFRSLAAADPTSSSKRTAPSTAKSAGRSYDYYIQLYPLPHRYQRLDVPPRRRGGGSADDAVPAFEYNPRGARGEAEQSSTADLPPPSFDTPDVGHTILTCGNDDYDDGNHDGRQGGNSDDGNCTGPLREVPFFPDNDHGTACCISLNLDGEATLVGISHAKLSLRNPFWRRDRLRRYDYLGHDRFVSRFLAYRPTPPFDIVARSGWFCLGFADEAEGTAEGGNSLAGRNTERAMRLDLFNDTYDCPVIHFASGLAEYVGNASRAVISYGVNDCHPRMMVVEKEGIARLLLGRV